MNFSATSGMGGRVRRTAAACLALTGVAFATAVEAGDTSFGPFGPESPRMREQLWLLPGADPRIPLRATVFRPTDAAGGAEQLRRPLVVINHGTDATTRESVSMPVFYWLSKWFVDRGYAVVLPQRRGYGATAGEPVDSRDNCLTPDHYRAGQAAADDIEAALGFMTRQPFIDPERIVVAGISTGGWAALALAARNPPGVRAIINFAGGRGAFAFGQPNRVCGPDNLVNAAGAYGREAKEPTLWLYARNDRSFDSELARRMADAWTGNGGSAELRILPPHGADGHAFADDRAGWPLWGPYVEEFLARQEAPADDALPQVSLGP